MSTEIKINMSEYKITNLPQRTEDQLYQELIDWYIKLMAISFFISPDDLRKSPKELQPRQTH